MLYSLIVLLVYTAYFIDVGASLRPSTLSTRGTVPVDRRTPIPGNPPHLFLPADQVNPRYHSPGDENPDNWVTRKHPLATLPRSVIIPMISQGGKMFGEITVGTPLPGYPEQKFKVEFDTGSTALWVLTPGTCARMRCDPDRRKFNPALSQSYRRDGFSLKSVYGSGEISGIFGEDTITIGQGENKLVINNQRIGEASTFRGVFEHMDLLCGMSLVAPPMMDGEPDSLLYTMAKQYGTTLPFGFYFNKYNPDESRMIFGEGYQTFIEGELNSHQVHPVPFRQIGEFIDGWFVKTEGWMIEAPRAKAIEMPFNTETYALVDTGASTITGPEAMIKELNENIFRYATFTVNTDFTFDCSIQVEQVYTELPDLSIFIDGKKYTIAPYQYIGKQSDTCRALLDGISGKDYIVIGRPIINKYFTRFDHSNKLVQFALAKQDLDHQNAKWHMQLEQMRWG